MELKPGFNQNDVGIIPDDWEVLKLKDIAPLQRGFDLPTSQLKKGDYPVVYSNGVMNYHSDFMVNGPGVITGRSGTIGNVHYVSENYWPHNTALWVTDFIDSHPKYIYYLYKSLKLERFGTGSGVPTLNRNDVHDLEVAIPKPEEQRAIATALSDVDALIISLDKLIAKKRDIKQAAMQQLLTGKKRLPGFGEGQGYKQSEVGVIPDDWIAPRIGDLFDFKNGLNKAKEFFGSGTPIVNYMDVFEHLGLFSRDVLGKVNVTSDEIRAYSIKQGDVFFTRTSETIEEIGYAAVLLEDIKAGVFSGFVLRARPKKLDLDLLFKKFCFSSAVVRKQITSTSSYTTRALTNGRLLSQVILPCPAQVEEQRAIATVLSDMDAEITSLEARRDKTRALKQGMMQELLTGRIRLV